MNAAAIVLPAERPFAGSVLQSGDARADLAEAIGRCEAGQRATAAVPGADLARVVDLVQDAARRLCPLVVRTTSGADQLGLFAAADCGAGVLLARSAAELPGAHLLARLWAERTLLPVVLASATAAAAEPPPAELPPAARELLGDPSDFVPSATPAQELLFGRHRRRVVRWFDHERPVLRGQHAGAELATLQRSGVAPFFLSPAAELLQQVAAERQLATGAAWSPYTATAAEHADVLLIGLDDDSAAVAAALADAGARPRIGALALRALRPFPDQCAALLRHKRAVIVLAAAEAALAGDPPLVRELRAALARATAAARRDGHPWKDKELPHLATAIVPLGGAPLARDDLAAFARECAGGAGRELVYLGVDFAPLTGTLPKRRVLHETLRRAHPGLETLGVASPQPAIRATPAPPVRAPVPAQPEPTHDCLTRGWDVFGAAAAAGALHELGPDPYLAAGSTPALSALFRTKRPGDTLPVLTPAKCTACGACWTACPDGAWLPAVVDAGELLETGMRRAATAGASAEALRPLFGRLAKALPSAVAAGSDGAGAAVRTAAAAAIAKAEADRRAAFEPAATALAGSLDDLPLAAPAWCAELTPPRPGSPYVFALALDPDACKGCKLCIAACAPGALAEGAADLDAVQRARRGAALWRELPDTPGAVIAAARKLPEPGLLGALELSRHCLRALAPGDDAEAGSGARQALRTVLAVAEAHMQPRLAQQLHELDQLADEFGKRIREQLTGALPVADLDALHDGLATLGGGAVALSTLATRLDDVTRSGRVDTPRLQRLVDTARDLQDLRWRIAEGKNGNGRARAGLVIAHGAAADFAPFPWNPFAGPAVRDDSREAGHRALGLVRGHADALARDAALVRGARELLQRGVPAAGVPTTAPGFADLTADERALCPPLVLVADAALLRRGGLTQLAAVLDSDLPIKVLLLADAADAAHARTAPTAALLALAHRQAFVLATSIAHRDHFAAGALRAFAHPGPALLTVLAPSPLAAGQAPDAALALAADAVAERRFPLFTYDPGRPGAFGEKLSLAGNPDPEADGTDDPQRLAAWRTLQELAGVKTPFTHSVEVRAAEAVEARQAQAIAALEAEHASRLAAARAAVEQELLQRLQHKLTALAAGRRP